MIIFIIIIITVKLCAYYLKFCSSFVLVKKVIGS